MLCFFFINTKELIDKREDSAFLTTDKLLDLIDNSALDMRGTINLLRDDVVLREKIVVFIHTVDTQLRQATGQRAAEQGDDVPEWH